MLNMKSLSKGKAHAPSFQVNNSIFIQEGLSDGGGGRQTQSMEESWKNRQETMQDEEKEDVTGVITKSHASTDTTSYENDLGEFLGALSESIVMSFPGSPQKPYKRAMKEGEYSRKKTCESHRPYRTGHGCVTLMMTLSRRLSQDRHQSDLKLIFVTHH